MIACSHKPASRWGGLVTARWLLGCLLLANQAAVLAHAAFGAHQVCEHGEWIEAPDGAQPPPARSAARPHRAPSGWVAGGDLGLAITAGHAHCAAMSHSRSARSGATASLVSLEWAADLAVAPADRYPRARALYRLAPKQSPPVG